MLYLLCIICPPLAVLMAGKPVAFLLNLGLTCCFLVPGIIHAFAVVGEAKANKRHKALIKAVKTGQLPD
jgi:uncharacterized membrane protein YqaE (UPF0057 family)